ncbi:unnamed protein product [Linum tenue]|uniref:Uncharacterized protein n=1 Tax=Linum tenue TaxID=586396 RepID=A0AAV0GNX1_9ROSI|nr:unnamed protein product [Linum tenue]
MGPGGKRTVEYPRQSLTPRAGQKHASEYANSYARQYKRNKTGHNSRKVNGVQSAKLSSELGLISREYMDEIPIRWTKDFKKNHLRSAYDRLNMHLQVEDISEEAVQDYIDGLLQIQVKQQRSKLKKIFLECRDAVEARTMKPPGISQKNWDDLIDYWLCDKAKLEMKAG